MNDYVKNGGTLITCGQPGVLAGLCGVRAKGNAAFDKKLRGAVVKVDSKYSDECDGNNLIDDQPATSWSSGNTPMPHWAEIALTETAEVAKVELVCRKGSFQVKDMDVDLPDGDNWRTVKSVRDAERQVLDASVGHVQADGDHGFAICPVPVGEAVAGAALHVFRHACPLGVTAGVIEDLDGETVLAGVSGCEVVVNGLVLAPAVPKPSVRLLGRIGGMDLV